MTSDPAKILARKVILAKAAIGWERLLERLFPALMIVGLVLLASLSGFLNYLPIWLKLSSLAGAAIVFIKSLTRLLKFSWPTDQDALTRIEKRSGKRHRPATSWTDTLADEPSATAEQKALWNAHRERMAKELQGLKAGAPQSPLPRLDQNALRNALAIALLATGVLTAGSWSDRLEQAIATTAPQPATPLSLDAWLNPPSYTAKPPILLTRKTTQNEGSAETAISVPAGSELVVRLSGSDDLIVNLIDPATIAAETPVVLERLGENLESEKTSANKPASEPAQNESASGIATRELRARISRSSIISVISDGAELGSWPVNVIADAVPVVTIPEQINITPSGAFALPWKVSDDYGVTSLQGKLRLDKDKVDQQLIDTGNPFLATAPDFAVSMQKVNPKQAEGRSFQDLTAHPWAGLPVEIILEGRDQAGQTGESDVVKMSLPERTFSNELARALIEQRKNLFLTPDNQRDVVLALSALLVWPEGTIDKAGTYLGIRQVTANLYRARAHEDLQEVTDALWEIALSIESGNVPDALRKLQAIKKELEILYSNYNRANMAH